MGHGKVLLKDTHIRAIVGLPTPSSKREVRKFIGMVGHYRKFIKNFSDVVLPLTDFLKKEKKFQWSVECEEACHKIKSILTKYQSCSWVPGTGTGTGTRTGTRVRVPTRRYGYGYQARLKYG